MGNFDADSLDGFRLVGIKVASSLKKLEIALSVSQELAWV